MSDYLQILKMASIPFFSHSMDLFSKPMKDASVESGFDHISRATDLDSDSIEIKLEKDAIHYLKTDDTILQGSFKIVDRKGKDITADDVVAPVNFFPCALFESCEIFCNDVRISSTSHNSLPHKRMIEALLSYGEESEKTHLNMAMWAKDSPTKKAEEQTDPDNNTGFGKRAELVAKSKECHFIYWLQNDILNVDRYFPNDMKLRFVFHKSTPDWCLVESNSITDERKTARGADYGYKIKLTSLSLHVRKVVPTPALLADHTQKLSKNQNMIYPYTRSKISKFTQIKGATAAYLPSVESGRLPTQVYMVMLKTKADLGDISTNPFYYEHFNLSKAVLSINGQMHREYNCDFDNNDYFDLLAELYRNSGVNNSNTPCLITPTSFPQGNTIISWNLTPDKSNFMPAQSGNADIELNFKKPLEDNTTFMVLSLYDDTFLIDNLRNIIIV